MPFVNSLPESCNVLSRRKLLLATSGIAVLPILVAPSAGKSELSAARAVRRSEAGSSGNAAFATLNLVRQLQARRRWGHRGDPGANSATGHVVVLGDRRASVFLRRPQRQAGFDDVIASARAGQNWQRGEQTTVDRAPGHGKRAGICRCRQHRADGQSGVRRGAQTLDPLRLNRSTAHRRSILHSAGIAMFVSERSNKAHWIEAGRGNERFTLQVTALAI